MRARLRGCSTFSINPFPFLHVYPSPSRLSSVFLIFFPFQLARDDARRAWEERTRGPRSAESNFNSLHTFGTALEVDRSARFRSAGTLISRRRSLGNHRCSALLRVEREKAEKTRIGARSDTDEALLRVKAEKLRDGGSCRNLKMGICEVLCCVP